jgi:hypothetical protein
MMQARRPFRALGPAALVAALAAAVYLAARPDAVAADKEPAAKAAAGALDYMPADAVAVISTRVADLWNHPAFKAALEKKGKDLDPVQQFTKSFGVPPDAVERFTFVEQVAKGPEQPLAFLTTAQPYDKKAILAAVDAKEQQAGDRTIYVKNPDVALCFLDERTVLYSNLAVLQSYLKRPPAKDGPLAPVRKLAAEKHVVVVGVSTAALAAHFPTGATAPDWARPLLKSELATLTVDLDGQVKVEARAAFANEADAKAGATAANDALDVFRGQFVEAVKELTKDDDAPKLAALLQDAKAALREAKAEQKGTAVEVAASLKLDPDATPGAVAEAVDRIHKAAKQVVIANDLKQLALGTISYADTWRGNMPPAAIYDKDGKALLSWRVAILPYIDQQDLYKQFHLDEPWDSDNNKKLLERMPETFAPKDSEAFKKHETHFQAFVGKESVFEKGVPIHYPASITDGTSNTIMFVEAKQSVPWTKPEDVPFDEGKLLPKLGGLSKGGFFAAFCDGSVRFLPATLKEETLHALVTRSGGEVIPDLEKQP